MAVISTTTAEILTWESLNTPNSQTRTEEVSSIIIATGDGLLRTLLGRHLWKEPACGGVCINSIGARSNGSRSGGGKNIAHGMSSSPPYSFSLLSGGGPHPISLFCLITGPPRASPTAPPSDASARVVLVRGPKRHLAHEIPNEDS